MEMPNEKAKEIYEDLKESFDAIIEGLELDDIIPFYLTEIRIQRKMAKHSPHRALPEEKIVELENAVKEFEAIYEAEKAEAAKMPLSRHEAERLKKLFEDAEDHRPLPEKRSEH